MEVQTTGVIVVDVQGDFTIFKNGALAVTGTDKAFIEKVQKATESLHRKGFPVFATQDWHPSDHISFFSNHKGKKPFDTIDISGKIQVLWPPHCVQDTENAKVLIDNSLFKAIVKKGVDARFDSYSGFRDDGWKKTKLDEILKKNGIRRLIIYGIATDYCVRATAMDAVDAGYKVTVIVRLSKGVASSSTERALQEMKGKGITILKDIDKWADDCQFVPFPEHGFS